METAVIALLSSALFFYLGRRTARAPEKEKSEYVQATEKKYKNKEGFLEAVKRK